jgi:DHA1 family bicyclomycin/chloramphenicol resistance-like MFS transporter
MFPLIGVGVVGASMSTRFVDRFGAKGAMRIHVIVMMTTAVIGMVLNYQFDLAWPWLLVPAMIYSFAMAALRPIISVYNMDYYPKNRGLAASVQQSLQTLSFATCAGVLVPLIMGHGWMYYLVLVGASLCVGGLWFVSMVLRPKYLPQED